MGPSISDYRKVAPPYSFIHVDQFKSPKQLALYLHKVANDKRLFLSYFDWKQNWRLTDTKFICRLCAMVHLSSYIKVWYKDINEWWSDEQCSAHSLNISNRVWNFKKRAHHWLRLTNLKPLSHFLPPENVKKSLVSWCFQGYRSGTLVGIGLRELAASDFFQVNHYLVSGRIRRKE